jgi:hypothetical protein
MLAKTNIVILQPAKNPDLKEVCGKKLQLADFLKIWYNVLYIGN